MSRGSKPGEHRGGRQKGTPNNRTKEITAIAGDVGGSTPKDVMLQAMRLHWAQIRTDEGGLDWGHIAEAVECAARAAPYVHPRLVAAAVAVRLPSEMSDDELIASAENAEQAAEALALRGDLPSGTDETRH